MIQMIGHQWPPRQHNTPHLKVVSTTPYERKWPRKYCLKNVLKNTDDWYNGLDLGRLVGLMFIDLKKAFDTVDHDILCAKLKFMVFSSESCFGSGHTYPTVNNSAGLMVLPQTYRM